ncbi:branched-chain amino acid ABC transporter permease [Mesorhizobium sp. CO1-1-8]|uniref:branched-chain amino acid ABC transporter permease n=1 Tax=Mesorhizobium sp. CO1-1-8 TaxID=2876631 RepID=UPI001CD1780F|nr:branched-chain amino acid ABC transporter permease [Mesorhizobium sp. CO1-1-8]MBZ9772471.1 branched-chain amino acid ABC transporter permease [Mesorhizobium sp. CO1-1-8]
MDLVKVAFDLAAFASIMILVVSGLAVIASLMGIFNMAHGEFVLLGAYTVFVAKGNGWPAWAGMLIAPFVVAAIGLLIELTIVRRLYRAPVTAMLATFGVGLAIREVIRVLLAGKYYEIPEPLPQIVEFAGGTFSLWRALIIVITFLLMVISVCVIRYTRFGLQIRASLENANLAQASGLSTQRLYSITFAIGAGLAGLAGALMVPLYSLSADLGLQFLVQAFLSVMLGGIGTFEGPISGAALMGALTPGIQWLREYTGAAYWISPVTAEVTLYVLLLTAVKIYPQGLFKR